MVNIFFKLKILILSFNSHLLVCAWQKVQFLCHVFQKGTYIKRFGVWNVRSCTNCKFLGQLLISWRGHFHPNYRWMCLLDLKNLTFPIPNFCTITHPSYTIFERKAPNFAFYHDLLKIHPIYVIWAPSSLMKTHQLLYQISRNSTPKGRLIHIYPGKLRIPCQCENPHGLILGLLA